jgi:hypothetical protein
MVPNGLERCRYIQIIFPETEEDMQALLLGAASLLERPLTLLMPAHQANSIVGA